VSVTAWVRKVRHNLLYRDSLERQQAVYIAYIYVRYFVKCVNIVKISIS